jgi:hypothetical protein
VELLTRDIVPLIDPLQRSFHKFLMLLVHRAHASAYFVVARRGKAPLVPPLSTAGARFADARSSEKVNWRTG